MSKKRKTLSEIQAALRSNTQYLNGEEAGEANATEQNNSPCVPIRSEQWEDLTLLAEYLHTTPEALLALAVDDLLALRSRMLKEAKEQKDRSEE
jgi:hypothetical protein